LGFQPTEQGKQRRIADQSVDSRLREPCASLASGIHLIGPAVSPPARTSNALAAHPAQGKWRYILAVVLFFMTDQNIENHQ
jgi:hypothetical protein